MVAFVISVMIVSYSPRTSDLVPLAAPDARQILAEGIASVAVATGWYELSRSSASWSRPSCPCSTEGLLLPDRLAVRFDWKLGGPAGTVVALGTVGAALALSAGLAVSQRDAIYNSVQVLEAVVASGLIGQVVKITVSRPYPYLFRDSVLPSQFGSGENYNSFWSGHTAVSAAAAASALLLVSRSWSVVGRALAIGCGVLVAVTAGVLEMAAGFHFPTDIVAGAAGGLGVSFTNAVVHSLW